MRRTLTLLTGICLAMGTLLLAAPANAISMYSYTIDCNDPTSFLQRVIEPGTTITLTVLNCQQAVLVSHQGNNTWSPASPETLNGTWSSSKTFEVAMGADGVVEDFTFSYLGSGQPIWVQLISGPQVASPSGDLLETDTVTITPNPGTFQVTNSGLTALDASTCGMLNGAHSYGTTTVTVTQTGTYTFRVTATDPGTSDPVIGIYTSFDPSAPEANLLSCNDDGGKNGYLASDPTVYVNNLYSSVTVDLIPGTYTLLGAVYGMDDPTLGWTFVTDQNIQVQLWGPPLPGAPAEERATLANTGGSSGMLLPVALGGIGFGLAIFLLASYSKRNLVHQSPSSE